MSQQKTIYEKWEEGDITILPPNPIVKLVYKSEFFDIEAMKIGERTVTTITSEGIIVREKYNNGSRKPYSTQTTVFPQNEYQILCNKLETCIASANRCDMYIDDCSEELKLIYKYGRSQVVERGLGDENTDISHIMWSFLEKIKYD